MGKTKSSSLKSKGGKKTLPVSSKAKSSSSSSDSDIEPPKVVQIKSVPKDASSDSSEADSEEVLKGQKKTTKVAAVSAQKSKVAVPAKKSSGSGSDSSSDDDTDTPSEKDIPVAAPKKIKQASSTKKTTKVVAAPAKTSKVVAAPTKTSKVIVSKKKTSDSDSSSSIDDEESPEAKNITAAVTKKSEQASSSDSDSDSDSNSSSDSDGESDSPAAAEVSLKKPLDDASESSSDSDENGSDGEAKMANATVVNGKRKSNNDQQPQSKKVKLDNGGSAPTGDSEESLSIFVGRLSWNVDNDRLAQEFSHCGEVESATVQMDRNTGKSRGFGYVHFTTTEAVEKALLMNGQEIDGRPVNIDRSTQQNKNQTKENRAKAFGDETSPPSSTLFVGNLSFGVTEDTVWSFFNEHGVKNVRLPTDRETGRPKGFGYVEFEDVEGAKAAFDAFNGADIEGRSIRLDYSQPRDSSGGGGRGGGFGDRGGRGRGFGGGRGGSFGDRGGRGGGRGFGDRGGRGGGRGFGDRGGGRGFGDRGGGRGGRGAPRGGARHGTVAAFEGKKTVF